MMAQEKLQDIAPLAYLEQWPFPVFIFSTSELQAVTVGADSPIPSPTTPTLGTIRHKQQYADIPLIWANEKWKSFSHNRPLRSLLDIHDLKILNFWLTGEHQSDPTLTVTVHLTESVRKKLDLVRVPVSSSISSSSQIIGHAGSYGRGAIIIVHAIERATVLPVNDGFVSGRTATPRFQEDYFSNSDPNTPEAFDSSEMVSPMTEVEREPFMMEDAEDQSGTGWNDQYVGDHNALLQEQTNKSNPADYLNGNNGFVDPVELPFPMLPNYTLQPIRPPSTKSFPDKWEDIDWDSTVLGPRKQWPTWLETVISIVMQTPTETAFYYGPQYHFFHNRAFAKLLPGDPSPFGEPAKIGWYRTFDRLEFYLKSAWEGKPVAFQDDLWFLLSDEHKFSVETYHKWYMLPVRDDNGNVVGLFNATSETTRDVIYRRRTDCLLNITKSVSSAKNQADFFRGITNAAKQSSSAVDLPYMLMYQTQMSDATAEKVRELENAKPLDPMPLPGTELPLSMMLKGSVGTNHPNPIVEQEITVNIPQRLLRKKHFQSKATQLFDDQEEAFDRRSSAVSSEPTVNTETNQQPGNHEPQWPIREAIVTGKIVFVEDAAQLSRGFELRSWERLPQSAVVIPLLQKSSRIPNAVLILGLNVHRPWNETYRDWISTLRLTLGDVLAAVKAFELESIQRDKAKALADAMSNFLSNAAHELKSPLTLLVGPIEDIVNTAKDNYTKKLAKTARKTCTRLSRLVSSLMDYSKLEAGKLAGTYRPIPVGGLTMDLATVFEGLPAVTSGRIKLNIDCQQHHVGQNAFIDVDFWEKIVSNLMSNAFKYTREGSVSIRVRYSQDSCILSVSDTGIGIPQDDVGLVTQRFHRVESSAGYVEGTGIGLAYTSELVKLHGGRLDVQSRTAEESADGSHGSTFTVTIPLGYDHLDRNSVDLDSSFTYESGQYGRSLVDAECQNNSDTTESSMSDAGSSSVQIRGVDPGTLFFKPDDILLVCDDNNDLREYIASLFMPFVRVEQARDGVEGLEVALRVKPTLILSDVSMPRMSGTELLAKVKSSTALEYTPVILITAKAGEDDRVDGILQGADDYMAKPFQSREVIARVNMQMMIGKKRRELEQNYLERTAEMDTIGKYSPVGIARTTPEGSFYYCNSAWFELSGIEPVLPVPDWSPYVVPEDLQRLSDEWFAFLAGKDKEITMEWRWTNGNYVQGRFVRLDLVNPKLRGTIGCVTDITPRQTFISSVSHELRTPLYSISGLCAVMQNSPDLTPAQAENLSVIASSADDLQRIVTDILDMAKLESGGMTAEAIPFDLRDALESSLESVAHMSRAKGMELVLENDVSTDPPGRVIGDPHRLRQCLLNLLSNAVKFSRSGDRTAYIKVGWTFDSSGEDSDMITINVTDNGIGMPKSKMKRLFHSFSQIDASITRQYGGSGLGLSITRGLARLLGGDCWAESVEGEGSTFYLRVQVKHETTAAGDTPEQYFRPGPPRRGVLYAPRRETSEVLVRNLRQFNIATEIISEHNGSDLLEPPPHFLIIDIENVADMREKLSSIRSWAQANKTLYLIALTEVSAAMETLSLTHESIVTKPVKARALHDATQHLVETQKQFPRRSGQIGLAMDQGYGKKYPLNILYVDDNSVNTMVGKKLLSRFGYNDIDICYDGSQAVAAAEATRYDLILLDLQMPVCDGYTALARIRASDEAGTPVIVALTANADEDTRRRCVRSGFDGFLSKPLVIRTLAETLRNTYEGRYDEQGSVRLK